MYVVEGHHILGDVMSGFNIICYQHCRETRSTAWELCLGRSDQSKPGIVFLLEACLGAKGQSVFFWWLWELSLESLFPRKKPCFWNISLLILLYDADLLLDSDPCHGRRPELQSMFSRPSCCTIHRKERSVVLSPWTGWNILNVQTVVRALYTTGWWQANEGMYAANNDGKIPIWEL